MTDSTRRSIRTAYQTLIALLTVVPVVAAALLAVIPASGSAAKFAVYVTSAVAGVAAVSKVLNALEDASVLPAWLKDDPSPSVPGEVLSSDGDGA